MSGGPPPLVRNDAARIGLALAVFGIAATLLTFALTMRDAWSPPVFWTVVGVGLVSAFPGVRLLIRPRGSSPDQNRAMLAAEDCRELNGVITALLDDQLRVAPHDTPTGRRGRQASRRRTWEEETVARYRDTCQKWALQTFDEAIALGVITARRRPMVLGGSVDQIKLLPALFKNIGLRLEHLAADGR
jgi:hypothetical protein